jgi:hypothetical protein
MLKEFNHPHMFLTEQEACELSLIPGISVIIPTYNNNPRLFALSFLSVLVNSSNELNHIIVSINGTDQRTGDTENQDIALLLSAQGIFV